MYPELVKYGDVDVLVSGIQADVAIPFPVKYRLYGMSFIFGRRGGVDIVDTAKRLKLFRLMIHYRKINHRRHNSNQKKQDSLLRNKCSHYNE